MELCCLRYSHHGPQLLFIAEPRVFDLLAEIVKRKASWLKPPP
jgi:hypothetical protein